MITFKDLGLYKSREQVNPGMTQMDVRHTQDAMYQCMDEMNAMMSDMTVEDRQNVNKMIADYKQKKQMAMAKGATMPM